MKSWFTIEAKSKDTAEIVIYDEVGLFGVSAKQFSDELRALGEVRLITLRINSPGGDVFDGFAIYNMLKRHKARVEVIIDGLAASIASVIAMAGDKISMPENALMMIHRAWGGVLGNAEDMEDFAETLKKIDAGIIAAYRRSGKSDEELSAIMEAESWFSAEEAVAAGFADEILEAVKLAALFDLTRFANPPKIPPPPIDVEQIRAEAKIQAKLEIMEELKEIYALCAEAGVADLAEGFIAQGRTVEWVKDRLQHADAIRSRCAAAGMPHRAEKYIRANAEPHEVSTNLIEMKLAMSAPEIDSTLTPEAMGWKKKEQEAPVDTAEIYRQRKAIVQKWNRRAS